MLRAQLAGDLRQRDLLQNLLSSDQHLLVQVEPLLGPVLPGILVAEPEEDGSVDGHWLKEDERPVEGDVDHVLLGRPGLALESVAEVDAEAKARLSKQGENHGAMRKVLTRKVLMRKVLSR